MDIVIEPEGQSSKKRWWWGLAGLAAVAALVVGGQQLWVVSQTEYSVDRESLVLSQVREGAFTVSVRGTGLLVPEQIHWLSTSIEGRVEFVAADAGTRVREGDLIVQMSNDELVQRLAEAQWELEAIEAEAVANRVAQESALLEKEAAVLHAKLNYESSLLNFDAQEELIANDSGAVSKLTFERTALETNQYLQRWEITKAQLAKQREDLKAQSEARAARVNKTRKLVERMQRQVDDLRIVAAFDSIVLEMPTEQGQRVMPGTNMAKLASVNSLVAELKVPELQIQDVVPGQAVLIDTRNSEFEGTVRRVDPAVVDGSVLVEVSLPATLPPDARPDLSVDGEIMVAHIPDAVYVDRPLFAQSRSNASFYRVSKDGRFAERTAVSVGQGSVSQIQVVNGLEPGDVIVTSDSTRFESYHKIRLN